jgi:hypothetical protein
LEGSVTEWPFGVDFMLVRYREAKSKTGRSLETRRVAPSRLYRPFADFSGISESDMISMRITGRS